MNLIRIRGVRTHNLKNFDLDLPRDKFIIITGLSGSGKSSLAFDTIFAEGQRRYVESLSAYARQFLSVMEKPDIDSIEGLSPAIAIEQKSTSHNPRSTVGTITEIYDYLRLLFARIGQPHCPHHHLPLQAMAVEEMVDKVLALPEGRYMLLAPVVQNRKGEHSKLLDKLRAQGFVRARLNGELVELDQDWQLDKRKKHQIDIVVDRFAIKADNADLAQRLAQSFETALQLTEGISVVAPYGAPDNQAAYTFSNKFACTVCGFSVPELEPKLFSFNNPAGACPECDGLGVRQQFLPQNVVVNPFLSLAGGAVRGWDRRNKYYYQMLQALSAQFGVDLETPFENLDPESQNLVLYGSGKKKIHFVYRSPQGREFIKDAPFEGIIPNMQRRYQDSDSDAVRDELAKYLSLEKCPSCDGARLNLAARHVTVDGQKLEDIVNWSIGDCAAYFKKLKLTGAKKAIGSKILREVSLRLEFLINVGLDYLSLGRSAETLSGGEAQRIRLASQIGAGLVGVMYVLDEPSIGLHQRDNDRLLKTLRYLTNLGNTVIVVEHDEDAIRAADFVVDIGPGAGVLGGEIVALGTPEDIGSNPHSITGQFLTGKRKISVPQKRRAASGFIEIRNACANNLKNLSVKIPLGVITCVTGVSGSGKSTLINDTLIPHSLQALGRAQTSHSSSQCHVAGLEQIDKLIAIDQSPIGRTPRSNPATYTGLFTTIRELFSNTAEARARGYQAGRFSFNVKGGRCEACQGDGLIKVEMHFLADVYVHCDLCQGKRYNRETLEILYKGKNIHQVLAMTVAEAFEFFQAVPILARKLQTLLDVGLSYITLGQNATTLSGGEAQRIKLARELSKRDTGRTLYVLDEPTTGLHFHDVEQLLDVIHRLCAHGNSIVIIEHNLDVIKTADWIIDLGPEGGSNGGQIVAQGTPEHVAKNKKSYTGLYLKPLLERT